MKIPQTFFLIIIQTETNQAKYAVGLNLLGRGNNHMKSVTCAHKYYEPIFLGVTILSTMTLVVCTKSQQRHKFSSKETVIN